MVVFLGVVLEGLGLSVEIRVYVGQDQFSVACLGGGPTRGTRSLNHLGS